MVNFTLLIGNLVADPDCRTTQTGKELCRLRLATHSHSGGKKFTQFHNVTVWGRSARTASGFKQGDTIKVQGSLQTRKYTDKEGADQYITEINSYFIEPISLAPRVAEDNLSIDPEDDIPF